MTPTTRTLLLAFTPPDLKKAYYASDKKDELVLEFDQPLAWNNATANHFYLDGTKGRGNVI